MLPWASQATATTRKPAITALAGFVPWAETGMRHTSRWASPRLRWYARTVSSPAYSPWAPELGWSETAEKPVTSASQRSRSANISWYPRAWSRGANGWSFPSSGHVTGSISEVPLSFMVHEPSGIIECASERSRDCSRCR